jgi:hypothetical protein
MRTNTASTRRSFLKRGALLVAPLAAAAVPAAVIADNPLKARVARLENEAAIRKLHQRWLRGIHAGADDARLPRCKSEEGPDFQHQVRRIAADHAGQPDVVELAADGKSAIGRFPCVVEIETAISQDCTLSQMAHAQGGGFLRRTEHRVLNVEYVKHSGSWAIAKSEFES